MRAGVSPCETQHDLHDFGSGRCRGVSYLEERCLFDLSYFHHAVANACHSEPIEAARTFARKSRSLFRGVEHAEVAAAFKQRMRGLLARHASQSFLVGDEINLALLVRAGDAQRAQLRVFC